MPTLYVEAFGQAASRATVSDASVDGEDLYSVFRAYSELMSWSTTGRRPGRFLWGMNDAELTVGLDRSRIGWVQIGLEVDSDVALVLPALFECFHAALARFQAVEISAFRVKGSGFQPIETRVGDLASCLNWFNAALPAPADALIVMDDESVHGAAEIKLLNTLDQLNNTGPFEFGAVRGERGVDSGTDVASGAWSRISVPVRLPEWTAVAAAWGLAILVDAASAASTYTPDGRRFVIRIDLAEGHRQGF